MSSRDYEADWDRKKNFLIRSLFHDVPELPTIRESEELRASPHHATENFFQRGQEGPLPDLIVERVPKRRNDDESELFYRGLRKRMRRYYRILFNKERDGSSSPDCEDLLYRSTYSRAGSDINVEGDLNNAFVEDLDAHSDSKVTDDETLDLEETAPVTGQFLSEGNEDESAESVSVAKESTKSEKTDESDDGDDDVDYTVSLAKESTNREKTDDSKDVLKAVSNDSASGENDKENTDPENSLKYTNIDSESTSMESLVLPAPAPTHQRSRANFLQATTGKTMQSNETNIVSNGKTAEKSDLTYLRKDVDQEKDSTHINRDETLRQQDGDIRKDESITEENIRNSRDSHNDSMDASDIENREPMGELNDKDMIVPSNNNKESSGSVNNENSKDNFKEESDKSINKKIAEEHVMESLMIGNEMMMEVEVMRSQNQSPSTQSLGATSNSTSPPNVHIERRDEIMLRHSLVDDRESMGVEFLRRRAMDISETSPEDFHPFLRCSTPIPVERNNRDENMDYSSPTQRVQSEQRLDNMVTKSLVGKQTNDENTRQSSVESERVEINDENNRQSAIDERDERVEIAEVHCPSIPSLAQDKVTGTSKNKDYKNATVQTDDRTVEKENVFVDIGIQVQEAEKEVNSVHVQTDDDRDDEPFGSRRIFRSGANYFIFLYP